MVTGSKTGHMGRKLRQKFCDRCGLSAPILLRVQYIEFKSYKKMAELFELFLPFYVNADNTILPSCINS
jgi:hypothetical protein